MTGFVQELIFDFAEGLVLDFIQARKLFFVELAHFMVQALLRQRRFELQALLFLFTVILDRKSVV